MQPPALVSKRIAVYVTLGLLAILTAYVAYQIASPYLEALLAGAALATVFFPLHLRLQKYVKGPALAALLSSLLLIVTVIVPIAFAVTAIIRAIRQGSTPGADQL